MTIWDKTKFFAGFMAVYLTGLAMSVICLLAFVDWLTG